MISWIKQHKAETAIILIIFFVAAFLRFYKLDGYMTFLGDEGRDALVMKRILVEHDIPLLGPPTSVGNIYLGPLYYYMMAVPMAIFWLNPVAAAGMIAVIGVATVGLIYYLSRVWFGRIPAVVASFLYAVSPINIDYSRFSWNPNPAPFFALLVILGLYMCHKSKNFRWFILTGVALAFAVQMHYLAFILLPVTLILWIYELKNSEKLQNLWQGTAIAIFLFMILMSPLIIFDFRYNFVNTKALLALFGGKGGAVNLNIFGSFLNIIPIYFQKLIGRYMVGQNLYIAYFVGLFIVFMLFLSKKFSHINKWPYFVLGVWLVVGLLGLSLYKGDIYDHYLGFLNPVPYLLLGGGIALMPGKWKVVIAVVFLITLGWINFQKNPLLAQPNNQLKRTQDIARFIINESDNKPFNFALLAERNYDSAYQYYLWLFGREPKVVPIEVTDQLFVVCEDQICNPINNPKYEIAGFGWSKIEKIDIVEGVKVYKLIANKVGK